MCPICATFEASSLSYLLSHLRLVHSNNHASKSPVVLMAVHILPVHFLPSTPTFIANIGHLEQSSLASRVLLWWGRISPVFQPPESMLSDSDTDLQSLYGKCNYVGNEEVEVHTCFLQQCKMILIIYLEWIKIFNNAALHSLS